jgi:myo-inositol 2-dehydrogenase/D-chiro-inositol 1-dehydrogenase
LIEAAAETGKAIFCEKPVALDLTGTLRALATVAKKGVAFQIGFQRRFFASSCIGKESF